MAWKCVTVYTKDYELFSDIFNEIRALDLEPNEEKVVQGVTVADVGGVDNEYIDTMRVKNEVAVLRVRGTDMMILQHGDVFELLTPTDDEEEETEADALSS